MQKKTETQEKMDNICELLFDRTPEEVRQKEILEAAWLLSVAYSEYLRTAQENLSKEGLGMHTALIAGYWAMFNRGANDE
jgi:hypothetical protein